MNEIINYSGTIFCATFEYNKTFPPLNDDTLRLYRSLLLSNLPYISIEFVSRRERNSWHE